MSKSNGLRPIMFVGTGSDVGKSFISTGFCRIFLQDGYHPAPFKAQNMSLNSYATPEGLEIGRAQAVQAEAAGVPCHTDMNPVLLKPTTDKISQVVLNGKPAGNFSAAEYFMSGNRDGLFEEVKRAYHRLAARYAPIVMEGAGSISELNLKHRDITNMRMAIEAGAATYLIADIDRGGVFGSLYGTMALLDPAERACIKGIIINKFRGDPQLFEGGRVQLEELCQVPVVGVLPMLRDIFIEEEDSLAGKRRRETDMGNDGARGSMSFGVPRRSGGMGKDTAGAEERVGSGKVNIAVVLLQRLSNFTDFDRLERDPRVNLVYTRNADEIGDADIVILPGTKNTIGDLMALHESGLAGSIQKTHAGGRTVVGICGGYQMMGLRVDDPLHVESETAYAAGLGLLPVETVLQHVKTSRQARFRFLEAPDPCTGYEIHMGETRRAASDRPLAYFEDGRTDGYFANEKCWGTYIHGIFDNPVVIDRLLAPYTTLPGEQYDYRQYKSTQYDKLAALIRQHIDMEQIYKTLQT